ncbi:ankyrin repeat domain-containing protein [Campylobacter lari]|uniref:Ankyrin repeat domain-containing protein n=1 Tax=Campylobacter lari TaxID=201 RepID=A0A698FUT8_CAMLA|nr:ankyrin repeat domain-containing protein [Campylobacter lari]ECW8955343.1 ankyrin repeat domain-containing protein [Campylobacter lari]MBT0794918.1 ankyrin repeat domain-containing protein [Campylobacter lari]
MTKEKIISYEEVQANPMLKWFFDREIKHSIKDKYYKEWQEFIHKEGINVVCITEDPKAKDILELDPWDRRTILDPLFSDAWSYDYEFFEFILQFVKDQTWLNFLLRCNTIGWLADELDLEHTKKIIKLLVDKGANINASFYDSDGQYKPIIFHTIPLGLASKTERANKLELLHFLLELGADPNLKNSEDENLLHRFILSEEQKFANALIDSGKIKDINEIIEYNKGAIYYGESALILAVRECYSSTVKKLIEAGANVNVFNHFGNSALDLIENKSETIKKYLLKAGAKSSLELLGSEEKLREFKDEIWDQDEIQYKIGKEYKKQLKENYRAILEKTPLVFHRGIEVVKA